MIYNARILLGCIVKVYGYEGTVTVKLEKAFTENIPETESVFLEIEGKLVPFFISGSDFPGAGNLRLKFSGYDSFEKVNEFTGCRVFLNSPEDQKTVVSDPDDLIGYKVFSIDNSFAGTVRKILENPGQWLISVEAEKGNEMLIPFHEDLIIKIDKKKKIIKMDLPEGLTEIN